MLFLSFNILFLVEEGDCYDDFSLLLKGVSYSGDTKISFYGVSIATFFLILIYDFKTAFMTEFEETIDHYDIMLPVMESH